MDRSLKRMHAITFPLVSFVRSFPPQLLICAIALGASCSFAGAHVPQNTTLAAATAQEVPAKTVTTVLLADGSPVLLRNSELLSSETAQLGDEVEFFVVKRVKAGELVLIPEGAIAKGKIVLVEKKRRKGRGGKLGITFEQVQLTTGETVKLRGKSNQKAGGQMGTDMAVVTIYTAGLATPALPLLLLEHGEVLEVRPGTRFEALVDGDYKLDREQLEKAQAGLGPWQDVGVVYVYRLAKNRASDYEDPVTCGEAMIGRFSHGNYVRLELPPGLYWFHTGYPSGHVMTKNKPDSFFQLRVESGRTYYLRMWTKQKLSTETGFQSALELVDPSTGVEEIYDIWTSAESAMKEITPETLTQLQVQPKAQK
jgi:hypothetical protein